MTLAHFFPSLNIDVCELDPAVLAVAQSWFGFAQGERLQVRVGNIHPFINFDVFLMNLSPRFNQRCPKSCILRSELPHISIRISVKSDKI